MTFGGWLSDFVTDSAKTLAPFISGGAFALALRAVIAERRRLKPVHWDVNEVGRGTYEGIPIVRVRITNAGSGNASTVTVSSVRCVMYKPEETDSPPRFVRSGEGFNLNLFDEDLSRSWLMFSWMDTSDRRFGWTTWRPLLDVGPLQEELDRQINVAIGRWRRRVVRIRTWLGFGVKPVGPHAALEVRIRHGLGDKTVKRQEIVFARWVEDVKDWEPKIPEPPTN